MEPHPSWSVGIDVPRGPVEDAIFERILKKLGKRPLAWVLPASELLKNSALPGLIAERRYRCGDIVFPKGYAGSLHPLLTHDELEKEVGWGLRNPWSTGVADLFGTAPDLLMPRLPDLARKSACALYRQMGFRSIGVPAGSFPAPDGDGPKPIPYLRIPDAAGGLNRWGSLRGAMSRHNPPLLLIDLYRVLEAGSQTHGAWTRTGGAWSPSVLDAVLDEAVKATAPAGPLSPLFRLLPTGNGAACGGGWDAHAVRRRLVAVGELRRKKRRKNEEYARILSLLAEERIDLPSPVEEAGLAPRRRALLAHMQGEVLLAGSDFDVLLAGGRFCGITSAGRTVLPRIPAESSLTVRGARLAFRTVSAFSFEGDGCTGLREELRLERFRKSAMTVDYFFLDGFPHLLVNVEVSWPDLGRRAPIDGCVPFGLRLFPMGPADEVLIHGSGPEGDALRIPGGGKKNACMAVSGSFLHVVRGTDGVTLSFPTPSGASPGLVLFRVVEDGKGAWLEANPFGSWAPFRSDWTGGRTERFTLAIGIGGSTPPRKPPPLPREITEGVMP